MSRKCNHFNFNKFIKLTELNESQDAINLLFYRISNIRARLKLTVKKIYSCNDFKETFDKLFPKFDIELYKKNNPNKSNGLDNESIKMDYFCEFLAGNISLLDDKIICSEYPWMYSKYKYGITSPYDKLNYNILNNNLNDKNNETAVILHCYNTTDIKYFDDLLKKYSNKIDLYLNIVNNNDVNFIKELSNKYNCMIIQSENRGYDYASLILILKIIFDSGRIYKYCLKLHSKTDINLRNSYTHPYLLNDNLNKIINRMNTDNSIGLLYSATNHPFEFNWMSTPVNTQSNGYRIFTKNYNYLNELFRLIELDRNIPHEFNEGSTFFCKFVILEHIYKDRENIYYNLTNTKTTVDFNWYMIYYMLNKTSDGRLIKQKTLDDTIKHFYTNKLEIVNNIPLGKNNNSMADGMFEHSLERLFMPLTKALNLKCIKI